VKERWAGWSLGTPDFLYSDSCSPVVMSESSWHAKLDRSREHLREFEQFAAECLRVGPEDMTLEGNKEVGEGTLVTQTVIITGRPIPPRLSAIAGDAFHNLRSAVDHMAVAMSADQRAAFPIIAASVPHRIRELERFLSRIPKTAANIIRHVQPYRRADPEAHPLAILQELDNLDKHRALMLVAAYYQTESAEPVITSAEARVHAIRMGSGVGGRGLQELFSLDLTIPKGTNIDVHFTIRSEVKFASEGAVKERNVLHVGQELLAFTSSLLNQLESVA
jgi:hypothetical protein